MSGSRPADRTARPGAASDNALIVSTVSMTFMAFLTVALPLAVLPVYVRNDLGWGTVVAGFTVSLQYVATVLSRARVGQMADAVGPKLTVMRGLLACVAGGVLMVVSALLGSQANLSLGILLASRLALGIGESLVSTGAIAWAIGRTGPHRTARIISWNGVATYGALAIGAPLGVILTARFGFRSIGACIIVLAATGLAMASRRAAVPVKTETRLSSGRVFRRVLPHGLVLALSSMGFGTITTFGSLFFDARGWSGAALALSCFGLAFILIRLLFADAINRVGGLPVARLSLAVEVVGLTLLWGASLPGVAMAAAALTGAGFSLVFPALGVEAVARVPPQNRGAALGLYSVFLDVALGITGPAAGLLAGALGFSAPFLFGAVATAVGFTLSCLLRRTPRPEA